MSGVTGAAANRSPCSLPGGGLCGLPEPTPSRSLLHLRYSTSRLTFNHAPALPCSERPARPHSAWLCPEPSCRWLRHVLAGSAPRRPQSADPAGPWSPLAWAPSGAAGRPGAPPAPQAGAGSAGPRHPQPAGTAHPSPCQLLGPWLFCVDATPQAPIALSSLLPPRSRRDHQPLTRRRCSRSPIHPRRFLPCSQPRP